MTEHSWINDLPHTISGPGDLSLRRVAPERAVELQRYYDSVLTPAARAELFRFFTRPVFPLSSFITDATRVTYTLYNGDSPVAQTSVYNADEKTKSVTFGFTFVLPHERGAGHNTTMKTLLFRELASRGVREVWFRMDEANEQSRRGVERAGAQFSHVEDAPREYPDGRVGTSIFFRRPLQPPDWVFAASNGFAVRVHNLDELESLTQVALNSGMEQGVEWIQIQHAQEPELFVAFDRMPEGWRVSTDEGHAQVVSDVQDRVLEANQAARLLARFL